MSSLKETLRPQFDTLISLLLGLGGLTLYLLTLAPTVLEGDAALFQYTPAVLGVTYPTGFPAYILLGKLWLLLLPIGEVAWRMNLFSAVCGAAALPLLYQSSRHLLHSRAAALMAVLTFATLPTFWRWATSAKTYTLNILLLSLMLCLITAAPRHRHTPYAVALLLGLSVSVHNTMLLLIPGILLLMAAQGVQPFRDDDAQPHRLKTALLALLIFLLPNLAYLYIPLRAEWLVAEHGRAAAIQHGLLADFYHGGMAGLGRYFSAADFTQGVASDWGLVPGRFYPVYIANLLWDEVGLLGVGLGLLGGIMLLIRQPRRFAALFLIYALPIPFVLAYGRGQQSAFLLPSFLIFCLFIGHALRLNSPWRFDSLLSGAILLALLPSYLMPRMEYGHNWLTNKWNTAIREEWTDALSHPLEPEAGLLAEWADLTPFWYLQHTENRRPDLRGIYPPTEQQVINTLQQGRPLYIAGLVDLSRPERRWMVALDERYRLLPWGRLVRIAPLSQNPAALLPPMPYQHAALFDNRLRLLTSDFAPQTESGHDFPVNLSWRTLAQLPPETTLSLRLTQGDQIAAQLDDTLLSGWFPRPQLPSGQHVLSHMPLPVPHGTLPGAYRLQLVVYAHHSQPWPLADGSILLDLGPVEINSVSQPRPLLPTADFNGELTLADYNYSASRVGQGKGFALTMLWQAQQQPVDNYTLHAELLDSTGAVLRTVSHQPPRPTAHWQAGHYVRDLVDLVLPASTPPGEEALSVQLKWQRPDGSFLNSRRWGVPWGHSLELAPLDVTAKESRQFTVPPLVQAVPADFAGKLRLLGYRQPQTLTMAQTACLTGCSLDLELVWQGQQEMGELYTVFLHVVNQQGALISQRDKVPGIRGKQPTTGWLPGEVITDPLTVELPPQTAPAEYELRLGLYLPADGSRLPVVDETGQPMADFVRLGILKIEN